MPGTLAGKTINDLISGCRPYIRSHTVIKALRDIQRVRNRSAHDGHQIADEDGLMAVRRLIDVLVWFASTGSGALTGQVPKLAPAVAAKAEFLAGLYVTLDYRPVKRFELSQRTVYQLWLRKRGLRSEYVELLLSKDAVEVAQVLDTISGQLLQTQLPMLTRFLILEEDGGKLPEPLRADCRVVTCDHFIDAFVNLDRHLADVRAHYPTTVALHPADGAAGTSPGAAGPSREAAQIPVPGDLLTTDERSGEMRIAKAGTASQLLEEIASHGGNLLIIGRSGSGKTILLKCLVASAPGAAARRYRFFFDLSLKRHGEQLADSITRTLAPPWRSKARTYSPCSTISPGRARCCAPWRIDDLGSASPQSW